MLTWVKNLPLMAKGIMGSLLSVLGIGVLVGLALAQLNDAADRMDYVGSQVFPNMQAATNLVARTIEMKEQLLQLVTWGNSGIVGEPLERQVTATLAAQDAFREAVGRIDGEEAVAFFELGDAFIGQAAQTIDMVSLDPGMSTMFLNGAIEAFDPLREAVEAYGREASEQAAGELGTMSMAAHETAENFAPLALVAVIIGIIVTVLMQRSIAQPVTHITDTMKAMAEGNYEASIPCEGMTNELGMMAKALHVFKDNALANIKLQEEKVARAKAEAEAATDQRQRDQLLASEIVALVEKVTSGELTERLTLQGREGVLAEVCAQVNKLVDGLQAVLADVGGRMEALAAGDLSQRIGADYQGAFGDLKNSVNCLADQLSRIVAQIQTAANEVDNTASEISCGTEDLSRRTEQAACSLEETAASTEELASTVKQNAENAKNANGLASSANDCAKSGGEIVEQAVTAMSRIEHSAEKITDIIGVIDEIAFQTNLLALNASIEAARAGEAGKGFAVVAQEVRQLAQRCAQAASNINALIQESNGQVKDGVDLVNRAGGSLNEIVGSIGRVASIVHQISEASEDQARGVQEINRSIASMDEMTQQNSALVEENSSATRALSDQAGKLTQLMSYFRKDNAYVPEKLVLVPQVDDNWNEV